MAAATPARTRVDCRLLALILGKLGSDFAGERDAAGRRAAAIVRAAGVSWDELLDPPVVKPPPPPPTPRLNVDAILSAALMRAGRLTDFELVFVRSLAERRPRRLSDRQLDVLAQLADKLNLRGQL